MTTLNSEYLHFLDELHRERFNMAYADMRLADVFGMSKACAAVIVEQWLQSFGERKAAKLRRG